MTLNDAPTGQRNASSSTQTKAYLGKVLNSLTGGQIDSIERLVFFDGRRRAELERSLNTELRAASGGRLKDWTQLLSPSGLQHLARKPASSQAAATPWRVGGVDIGQGVRLLWNAGKQLPVAPGGLSLNQVARGLQRAYEPTAKAVNQATGAPLLPLPDPASQRPALRQQADAMVVTASKGRYSSVGSLAHFDGGNKTANQWRAQLNAFLRTDAKAQAGGFNDWKQLLSPAERQQLDRTLQVKRDDTPATPLPVREGNLLSGIARHANQVGAPFGAQFPTAQDRSLETMRAGANFALQEAGLPKLQQLAGIGFNDARRAKADEVLGRYLHDKNLLGARANLPGGAKERIDHWTDLLSQPELTRFVAQIEKTLLGKAVALSGLNDPEGLSVQVPKQEAYKQISALRQQVQDYFGGAWPDATKPLIGSLDALAGYCFDRNIDALRERLTQSGRPVAQLASMGIGLLRTANPVAAISSLLALDQEIAKSNSTKPLEQALAAIGLQFKEVAGVGKDLTLALLRGDRKAAEAVLRKNYDLSTVEGQNRANEAIGTLLTVYSGAKLTQSGFNTLFRRSPSSAIVPLQQTPAAAANASRLAPVLMELDSLTQKVDDVVATGTPSQLRQFQASLGQLLGESRRLYKAGQRNPAFRDLNIKAERSLLTLEAAAKTTPVSLPPNTPTASPKPAIVNTAGNGIVLNIQRSSPGQTGQVVQKIRVQIPPPEVKQAPIPTPTQTAAVPQQAITPEVLGKESPTPDANGSNGSNRSIRETARDITPLAPNQNNQALEIGLEAQLLKGLSAGKDLGNLFGWVSGRPLNWQTRVGPLEAIGGGYATGTLELGNLERWLPGGTSKPVDKPRPGESPAVKPAQLATNSIPLSRLPEPLRKAIETLRTGKVAGDANTPAISWKAFGIANGPSWPGRQGNDGQYTMRLGVSEFLSDGDKGVETLIDAAWARNNVQRVDFDLHGSEGALAQGHVLRTAAAGQALRLNVVDLGGGNYRFAGSTPMAIKVSNVSSLPGTLLQRLPLGGEQLMEWAQPARKYLEQLGIGHLDPGELVRQIGQTQWGATLGTGLEAMLTSLPNVKVKFSANTQIAPGQILPRGLVQELNRQLNPNALFRAQLGSVATGQRLQIRTDLPPSIKGFEFPVEGVRDLVHALVPPAQWASMKVKLELEFPIKLPLGIGGVPIVTLAVNPKNQPGSSGAWRIVGEQVAKLNPSRTIGDDALGRSPLADVKVPLSNLLLRDAQGQNLSVAAVRIERRSNFDISAKLPRIDVASFVPAGTKPPQPDSPALLLYPQTQRLTVVPQAVVTALDGAKPLDSATIKTLQQQLDVFSAAGQERIRAAYLQFAQTLREGARLSDGQVRELLEFVELGLGRSPRWPASGQGPSGGSTLPNLRQAAPKPRQQAPGNSFIEVQAD